jgi:hypothetical protein
LIPFLVERGDADQDGDATAVLAEIFLFKGLHGSCRLHLCQRPCVALAPFLRGQICPIHAPRGEILPVVSHHPQERVISLNNLAVDVPDDDPDDIGIDQAPDLGFAFAEATMDRMQSMGECVEGRDDPL